MDHKWVKTNFRIVTTFSRFMEQIMLLQNEFETFVEQLQKSCKNATCTTCQPVLVCNFSMLYVMFSKLHHIHFFKLESFLGTIHNGFTMGLNYFCRSSPKLKILLHYTCFCSKYILKLSSYDYSFNQTHIIWLQMN